MNTESKSKTILVVDDEPDIVFVLKTCLEKFGYTIQSAFNGQEALDKVSSHSPDAIILDIMMPKVDGYSVNLKLKENPQTSQIPVIIMTGKGHLKELLDVREDLKVTAYLEKPFPTSLIVEKLREIFKTT